MLKELEKLSLRERKFATLKLKILDSFIEKSKETKVENISVKEIAKELQISEMTFYNYFKNKKELFVYFIELWNIEMHIKLTTAQPISAVASIQLIYKLSAQYMQSNYQFMMELIAFLAINGTPTKDIKITHAEMYIRFGAICTLQEGGFEELIMPLLQDALQSRALSKEEFEVIFIGLYNTFFATPLLVDKNNIHNLEKMYSLQIKKILGDV